MVCACMCAHKHMLAQVRFDCILVLCLVMGNVLQSAEITDTRVHYYYYTFSVLRNEWAHCHVGLTTLKWDKNIHPQLDCSTNSWIKTHSKLKHYTSCVSGLTDLPVIGRVWHHRCVRYHVAVGVALHWRGSNRAGRFHLLGQLARQTGTTCKFSQQQSSPWHLNTFSTTEGWPLAVRFPETWTRAK